VLVKKKNFFKKFKKFKCGYLPYQPLQLTRARRFSSRGPGALKVRWWFWTAWFLVGFCAPHYRRAPPREGKLRQDFVSRHDDISRPSSQVIAYVFDPRSKGCSRPPVPFDHSRPSHPRARWATLFALC